MLLTELAEIAAFDYLFTASYNLSTGFQKSKPGQKVYCFYSGNLQSEIVRTLQGNNNKTIEYLELTDGCICPLTLINLPFVIARDFQEIASKISLNLLTAPFLNQEKGHGFYVSNESEDYINYWLPVSCNLPTSFATSCDRINRQPAYLASRASW